MKIILTDDETARLKADAVKYAGLRELTQLIIKRVRGEVGDILMPIEQRVEGMILDFVKEVESRIEKSKEPKPKTEFCSQSYPDSSWCSKCGDHKGIHMNIGGTYFCRIAPK